MQQLVRLLYPLALQDSAAGGACCIVWARVACRELRVYTYLALLLILQYYNIIILLSLLVVLLIFTSYHMILLVAVLVELWNLQYII